jgi:cleavage stimulation factor subunit 1
MDLAHKGALKSSRDLYRMMVSQLFYDGYQNEAVSLARTVGEDSACPPSTRLATLVAAGLAVEKEAQAEQESLNPALIGGIDLDFETESSCAAPQPADYETVYVTSHKGACRAGAFNADGSLVATGSSDTSIKILDVDKMIAKSTGAGEDVSDRGNEGALHPVIRTLYDHDAEVTCLQFHPTEQVLISGSEDCTVKTYDFAKPGVKRSQKTITETYPVRCLSLHPCGDFLLVGTMHSTIRLYDIHTFQCYVGSNPKDQHDGGITDLAYNLTGSLYASASEDGDIRIWDAVSSRVINTFTRAHEGNEICSIVFSKNGKYLLSSGKDSLIKLWELSMSRCLIAYTGAGSSGKQQFRARACFSHTEDYVLFPDEKTTSLCSWDSRNAERKNLLSLGHNSNVRYLCHSPTTASFLTCSDDYRARFWHRRPATDLTNP